jgi:hypothetical protein
MLLEGGTKKTQDSDIATAPARRQDYRKRRAQARMKRDRTSSHPGGTMKLASAAAFLFVLLLITCPASAQARADDMRARLKEGQKVTVIDVGGQQIQGRITDLGSDAMTLASGRQRLRVPYADVVRIVRPDGLKNGALAGLAIGVGVGLAATHDFRCRQDQFCGNPNPGSYVAGSALGGGIGAALGVGIDALIGGDRTIYERGRSARIRVSPELARGRRAATIAVAW